jgi:hypothetical protein
LEEYVYHMEARDVLFDVIKLENYNIDGVVLEEIK